MNKTWILGWTPHHELHKQLFIPQKYHCVINVSHQLVLQVKGVSWWLYGHQKQRTNTFYARTQGRLVQRCTGLTCLYMKTGRCKCKCPSGVRWSREEGDIQESPLGCESISFGLRRSGTTSPYTTRDLHLLPPVILLLHLHTVPPSPGGGFTIRHAGWKVMETQLVLSDGKCGVGVVADQQRRLWWQLHFILTSWTFCSTHYISFRKWTNTQICRIR